MADAGSDFDVDALYRALDAERERRGITWTDVTRELNALFGDVTGARPIARSTLTGMRERSGMNGNGIIQMLVWLERSPESFCPDWPVKGRTFTRVDTDRILRWDGPKIYAALDDRRTERGLSWKQVADEIGFWFSTTNLKALQKTHGLPFPWGMRLFRWLGDPAADYVVPTPW